VFVILILLGALLVALGMGSILSQAFAIKYVKISTIMMSRFRPPDSVIGEMRWVFGPVSVFAGILCITLTILNHVE